jgi:hypothetical protein
MKPLPDVFAACCFEGDRWLIVSPSEWSTAAGRTFERREMAEKDFPFEGIRFFARDQLPHAATHLRTGPRRG